MIHMRPFNDFETKNVKFLVNSQVIMRLFKSLKLG